MAKDIKFRVRLNVDGKEQLVTATTTVAEMRKAVRDTEKAFKGLNKTILNLNQGFEMVRNVGEGISQLTAGLQQAARQGQALTQLTGATGGDMRALRSEMEAVAATFGKDFGEVLRSVNALAKGFGIEAADALKLVREGFVVGADAGGDFLDTVREYPRYFKEAGLSAEDFIAISANATRQGVFSDKGVDAIKEANIRLREMTTATAAALDGIGISSEAVMQGLRDGSVTTFQVMQQVAARLKELPPSASEVGTAIADIFGGPGEDAGLEYIKSLADVELSLGKVRDAAGGTADALDAQVGAMETVKRLTGEVADALSFLTPLQPFADMAGQAGMAAMGISSMAYAVKAFNVTAKLAAARAVALKAAALLCGVSASKSAAMARVFSASLHSTAAAATAAKLAIRGLVTATVVGAAIAGLTVVIEKLTGAMDGVDGAADGAADGIGSLEQASDTFKQKAAEVQVELEGERDKLGRLIKSGGDTAAMVKHLNDTYGTAFGYYQTAAEWYDTLTAKSRDYAAQLGYEAAARELNVEVAKAQLDVDELNRQISGLYKSGKAYDTVLVPRLDGLGNEEVKVRTKELKALMEERDKVLADGRAKAARKRLAMQRAEEAAAKVRKGKGGSNVSNGSAGRTGNSTPGSTKAPRNTIAWYDQELRRLQDSLRTTADTAVAATIQRKIDELEAAKLELERTLGIKEKSHLTDAVPGAPTVGQAVGAQADALGSITVDIAPIDPDALDTQPLDAYADAAEDMKHKVLDGWSELKSVVGGIQDLSQTLDGDADGWTKFTAVVDTAIQVANGIGGIIGMVNNISGKGGLGSLFGGGGSVGNAATAASAGAAAAGMTAMTTATVAQTAASTALIAANKLVAASFMEIAAASYFAAHAYIPFTGFAIGAGFVASAKAAVLAVGATPFAQGGVVSGPTLALVGEYAGASNNPEVIAPLDRLRTMLQPQGAAGGSVRFEIDGRKLVGVLANETRVSSKSGRRTNIRI